MKLLYVSIIACLFLTSCEREIETLENEEDYTQSIESTIPQLNNNTGESLKGDITKGNNPPTASEIFKNEMEWASYLAAKVIRELNNSERSAVRALIVNERIPLENLIGSSSQLQSFHDSFFTHLKNRFVVGNPGVDEEEPNKTEEVDPLQAAYDYLDYILNQNCVELYFPVGILDGYKDFISLSHPLTNSSGNYGYKRAADNKTSFISNITSSQINLNQFNITYIISRPERDMNPNSGCDYPQYSGINFLLFLQ